MTDGDGVLEGASTAGAPAQGVVLAQATGEDLSSPGAASPAASGPATSGPATSGPATSSPATPSPAAAIPGTSASAPAGGPRRRGLGRGLDALLARNDDDPDLGSAGIVEVDPHRVEPNPEQPRQSFDEAQLEALTESLRLHGLLQPIVVERTAAGGYQLVAGERRLRASRRAGLRTIPAVVRPRSDSARHALELALTENLLRAELSALDEATAFARLADTFGLTHEAIAARLGRSRSAVANTVRLLGLSAPVQEMLADGRLSAGQARALLAVDEADQQLALAHQAAAGALTVRQVEDLVARTLAEEEQRSTRRGRRGRATAAPTVDDEALRRGFEEALGTPVHLQRRRRGGRVVIEFATEEDLDALYERVNGPPL